MNILKNNKLFQDSIQFPLIVEQIEKLIQAKKNTPIIVAIDGRCGSGKTSLANEISKLFDCNIFHLDDYFLPLEMKTKERLAEPGGNVHYERFYDEIMTPLINNKDITYIPFQCSTMSMGEPIHVKSKKLNIVEGSYSLHPFMQNVYNYKIFLTHDVDTQKQRILKRNGEAKLKQFINLWIPLEELYFSELQITSSSDIVINTSLLW